MKRHLFKGIPMRPLIKNDAIRNTSVCLDTILFGNLTRLRIIICVTSPTRPAMTAASMTPCFFKVLVQYNSEIWSGFKRIVSQDNVPKTRN